MTFLGRLGVMVAGLVLVTGVAGCKSGLRTIGSGTQDGSADGSPLDGPSAGGGGGGSLAPDGGGLDVSTAGGAGGGDAGASTDGATDRPATPQCSPGQHMCPGGCVADDDVQTCGTSCTPCQAPTNGEATCDGTSCGGTCPTGMQLCLGACIDAGAACSGQCPALHHACGGLCPSVNDEKACGTSCLPCPVPAGATQATCDGTSCDFQCATGMHKCGAACAADDDAAACGTGCTVCPTDPHGKAQCVGGVCGIACATGFHSCGGVCVSNTAVTSCGTSSCSACQAPSGGTVTCDGTTCVPSCPTGMKLCAGACIDGQAECSGVCPTGTHDCGGICAPDTSVNSCGATSCAACPDPTGANGTTCDGTTCDFTCGSGYHRCGTRCAPDDDPSGCGATACLACPTDPNGMAACVSGTCGLRCNNGFHVCNGACVDNKAVATCGPNDNTSCSPCQAPTGGTVTCDGLACKPACPTGSKLCNGACIADATACNGMCPTGTHNCSGICKSDTDVGSCGTQCAPCPAPAAHGQATCSAGGACGVTCDNTYHQCAGTPPVCASTSAPACCTSADCTAGAANTVGTCNANVCSYACAANFKQCAGSTACVSSATCCTPCTNGFACESGTCATSCTSNADCVANHFCEHGACLGKITQITAAWSFACSLHDDGTARCWGYDSDGEFGTSGGPSPTVVPLPMPATQIAAGNRVACAVLADTSLWCWGELDGFNVSPPTPYMGLTGVKNVSLSSDVGGCAVLTSGAVKCWGRNGFGQLGIGTADGTDTTAYPVMTVPGIASATQVSHGAWDVCVLLSGGGMSCWGSNTSGQVGNGTFVSGTIQVTPDPVPSPTTVAGISGAIQVATSGNSTFAILGGSGANAGALMAWGNGSYAGRGNSSGVYLTPARIGGTTQFASISTWNPACAVTTTGTVMCWGLNTSGQTGTPAAGTSFVYDPTAVPGLSGVSSVACGTDFACAVTNSNLGVMCWGANNFGQLGNGTTGSGSNVPTAVAW